MIHCLERIDHCALLIFWENGPEKFEYIKIFYFYFHAESSAFSNIKMPILVPKFLYLPFSHAIEPMHCGFISRLKRRIWTMGSKQIVITIIISWYHQKSRQRRDKAGLVY